MTYVHVLIVAYGGVDDLQQCLGAVGTRFPVTVVDNSGLAACREVVEAAHATYVDPGRNLGFAGGVNVGLERIGRPWPDILLLNPDAMVDPGAVEALHERLLATPRAAAVAPALVGRDGAPQRVCWPFPSPMRMWAEAVGLSRLTAQTGFLVGAVLLLRGAALVEVGPFDDRYFLYAEETDWQRRATDAGWSMLYCPDVAAIHRGAGTSTDPALREARFHCAAEVFIRKWHGAAGWQAYRAAAVLAAVLRTALPDPARRQQARIRAVTYLRGPCRRLGTQPAADTR